MPPNALKPDLSGFKAAVVVLTLLAALAAGGAEAAPPTLETPVDCRIGPECFVQNYPDRDSGPGRRDFACGALTYDQHRGVDFRIGDLGNMRRGVAVTAAAAGVTARVRDGMADVSIRAPGAPDIAGREGGNAVVIDHGDGWETQYSHLRQGSILVKPGDPVAAGQPLGLIGLSGNTEFPHVDFQVRRHGRVIDPFTGEALDDDGKRPTAACGPDLSRGLWSAAARARLTYRSSAILSAGFANGAASAETARAGGYADVRLDPAAATLSLWAEALGAQPGDVLRLVVTGPDGRILADASSTAPKAFAAVFLHVEAPRPPGGWREGRHHGLIRLMRGGRIEMETTRAVAIAP